MKKKINKVEKLNIIPILDAVFIFIFFLLMTAQFMDLYEITTSTPKIEEVSGDGEAIKAKNFKLKVTKNIITLTEGVNEQTIGTYNWSENSLTKLQGHLLDLKIKNPKEKSIVFVTNKKIKYKKLVILVDIAQKFYVRKDVNDQLFRNIAFEKMN